MARPHELTARGIAETGLRLLNPSPAFERACAEMDAMAERYEILGANRRRKERVERRARVNLYSDPANYRQLLSWLGNAPGLGPAFLSVDEAVRCFTRRIARHRYLRANGRHSPELAIGYPIYRDRLTVARYFARFGKEIWQREAA